jgi:hypothetical protein
LACRHRSLMEVRGRFARYGLGAAHSSQPGPVPWTTNLILGAYHMPFWMRQKEVRSYDLSRPLDVIRDPHTARPLQTYVHVVRPCLATLQCTGQYLLALNQQRSI